MVHTVQYSQGTTHLKPEGVCHIQSLKQRHQGQVRRDCAGLLVGFDHHQPVKNHPANQPRSHLTEELQVQWANPRVQLTSNEEVVDYIAYEI